MIMHNKKFLVFYLFVQFFIAILSFFLICLNCFSLPWWLLVSFSHNGIQELGGISFLLRVIFGTISALSTFIIYPFVAWSTYKLLKNKPLSKFQIGCFKYFLFIASLPIIDICYTVIVIIIK